MAKIVTDKLLADLRACVRFDLHRDVTISKWLFLEVGNHCMTLYWLSPNGERCKDVWGWRKMTADEINRKFDEMEWEKLPI
jgi:hypothetical protein